MAHEVDSCPSGIEQETARSTFIHAGRRNQGVWTLAGDLDLGNSPSAGSGVARIRGKQRRF